MNGFYAGNSVMYGFDWTYILVLIGVVVSMAASANVKRTYSRYSTVRSASSMTGAETARRILQMSGINDVTVQHVSGSLTDHYDPSSKTVRLSDATFASDSVAAVGVAAHECGHVIQHHTGYVPLNIRTALVPAANIGSKLGIPMVIIGLMISFLRPVTTIGIFLFFFAVLFQVVTLPVEFDASSRGLKLLQDCGVLGEEELSMSRKVLSAAAMTYVAAAASSALQLLRLVLLSRNRRRD